MRTFPRAMLGIDDGDVELFSEFETGGDMWTGSGPRERRRAVAFTGAFLDAPVVHVSITLWDVDQSANLRAHVIAEDITRTGYALVLRTWSDTRIARARVHWIAFGAVRGEDDWDV